MLAERNLAYKEYKNRQIQKDKPRVDESKEHINKIFEVSQNNYKKNANLLETPGILNWILKYPFCTIKNIPPFSPTGDVNNSLFEVPNYQDWPKRMYEAFRCGETNKIVRKKCSNACRLAVEANLTKQTKNKNIKEDANHIYFAKLIERFYCLETGLPKGRPAWGTINGFIGPELKSEKEIQRRKRFDADLNVCKKARQRLSKYFSEKYIQYYDKDSIYFKKASTDNFEKFAQQMRQNIIDFETYCLNGHKKQTKI